MDGAGAFYNGCFLCCDMDGSRSRRLEDWPNAHLPSSPAGATCSRQDPTAWAPEAARSYGQGCQAPRLSARVLGSQPKARGLAGPRALLLSCPWAQTSPGCTGWWDAQHPMSADPGPRSPPPSTQLSPAGPGAPGASGSLAPPHLQLDWEKPLSP